MREEKSFKGEDELKARLERDRESALRILGEE
jgi:hypothetical protein